MEHNGIGHLHPVLPFDGLEGRLLSQEIQLSRPELELFDAAYVVVARSGGQNAIQLGDLILVD